MKNAIVIIPTYNEAETITHTLEVVFGQVADIPNWKVSILVVDDTSPDGTHELVRKLQAKMPKLKLFVNEKKSGLGGAYLKGMSYAFDKLGADVVFSFDADLSHDPTKIPLLLEKIDAGFDMAIGSRYIPGGGIPENWGIHRKFLSVVGNLFIMILMTDFSVHDWTSGYRAITKKVFSAVRDEMHSERFAGYTFQVAFMLKTLRKGFSVAEVAYKFKDRTAGKSKMGPEYLINNLIFLLRIRLQEILAHRIFKFAVVGLLGAVVQLGSLQLWRLLLPFQVAYFASVECAVLSNFILSNLWTFSDRRLHLSELPKKFLHFNVASSGSIIIQQILAFVSEVLLGIRPLFTIPFTSSVVDSGTITAVVGIFLGMFWNFFAYDKLIWKKKQSQS